METVNLRRFSLEEQRLIVLFQQRFLTIKDIQEFTQLSYGKVNRLLHKYEELFHVENSHNPYLYCLKKDVFKEYLNSPDCNYSSLQLQNRYFLKYLYEKSQTIFKDSDDTLLEDMFPCFSYLEILYFLQSFGIISSEQNKMYSGKNEDSLLIYQALFLKMPYFIRDLCTSKTSSNDFSDISTFYQEHFLEFSQSFSTDEINVLLYFLRLTNIVPNNLQDISYLLSKYVLFLYQIFAPSYEIETICLT